MTPKNILCKFIINCLQMLHSIYHFHARPTKVKKQVGNLLKLRYSQEIKGETEVDIFLSSFFLSPGVCYILIVMEGDKITEAIILVSVIIRRRLRLRKIMLRKCRYM